MRLSDLQTPCLVLDQGKLQRNMRRMRDHAARLGVKFRPHGKTAKNIEIMRLALEGQFGGIAVSTLAEAEYYFAQGIRDIFYAVGIAPVKLERVAGLIQRGADLAVLLESREQARLVAQQGRRSGVVIPALIEIDSDGHRTGVTPGDSVLVEIGRLLHGDGAALRGVLTHAGISYSGRSPEEIRAIAARERDGAVQCAEALRAAGLPCPVVSIGSTPTATFGQDCSGVTEVRTGVYMFCDLTMAGLGVCAIDEIAMSVQASVIGHQPAKDWIITDAGFTALSHDRRTARQKIDQGYGIVCDSDGKATDDLIVIDVYQEHGIIARRPGLAKGIDFSKFPIGSAVRILPNHACATATMHDRYHVVDGTREVLAVWPRAGGW